MQTNSQNQRWTATPLVSVVMVVCNVERFLAESIESILAQNYGSFEFVIVDFGSTDKTKAIVASYAAKDDRVKHHEISSCGLAEARNAACSFATGKYAAIMDADDVSLPDRLTRQVEFLETHMQVAVLGGAVEWIDTGGNSLIVRENPTGHREIEAVLRECCPLWQPSVMLRRDVFLAAGGYRAAFASAEDYDLWLRLAERCEIANLPEVVLRYRIHPFQVSMRKQTQQTLGILAARVSSEARRAGHKDPLDGVKKITPELLSRLGISPRELHSELVMNRRQWVRHMSMAGETSAALEAALAIAHSDLSGVEPWQIADLQLTIASLYWRLGKYGKSFLSGCRALVTRPIVAGRPLRPLLQRLRWV
jgi:glycosyltransferase involved in cell wall biosynthesis